MLHQTKPTTTSGDPCLVTGRAMVSLAKWGLEGKQLTETTSLFNLGGRLQPWVPSAQGLAPVFMLMVSAHAAFPQHRTSAPGGRCCFSSCLPSPGHTSYPLTFLFHLPNTQSWDHCPGKRGGQEGGNSCLHLGTRVPDSRPMQRRGEALEGGRRGRTWGWR